MAKFFDDQEELELFLILDLSWAGNSNFVVNESSGRLRTVMFYAIASELILITFITFLL